MNTYSDYESALDGLLSRLAFDELCPADAFHCDAYPTVQLGEDRHAVLCPAWEDGTCPAWPERNAAWLAEDLARIGFPKEFLAPTWDRVPEDQREHLHLYCDTLGVRLQRGEGLVLGGRPGSGKTAWLALLAAAAIRVMNPPEPEDLPGKRPRRKVGEISYVTEPCLLDDLFRDQEAYHRRLADLLIIDDLGTGWRSEGSLVRLNALFDDRYGRQLATVVTTNQSKTQIEADPAMARLVSRLSQRNPWLWTNGVDQRERASVTKWTEEIPAPEPDAPQMLAAKHGAGGSPGAEDDGGQKARVS
jgi:hypothetical protein